MQSDRTKHPRLFAKDDIICEAFDVAENKAVFANGVLTSLPEAILVSGSEWRAAAIRI